MATKSMMQTRFFAYEQQDELLAHLHHLVLERGQFTVAPDPSDLYASRSGWVVSGIERVEEPQPEEKGT